MANFISGSKTSLCGVVPLFIALLIFSVVAVADDTAGHKPVKADSHAPIGVMAEHMHKKGEWMLSFRYMYMDMQDNRINKDDVSPDFIVTNVPNVFAPPPTLRIVPLDMSMDMAMLGVMYAPSDWITLMLMGNYVNKEMNHVTYQGPGGHERTRYVQDQGQRHRRHLSRRHDSAL